MSKFIKEELNLVQLVKIIMLMVSLAFFLFIGISFMNLKKNIEHTLGNVNRTMNIYESRVNILY